MTRWAASTSSSLADTGRKCSASWSASWKAGSGPAPVLVTDAVEKSIAAGDAKADAYVVVFDDNGVIRETAAPKDWDIDHIAQ